MPDNLTVEEVANQLKVSKRTVLREIKRGKIKVRKAGRRYLISESEIQSYLGELDIEISKNIQNFLDSKKDEMVTLLQKLVSMKNQDNVPGEQIRLASYLHELLGDKNIRSVLYDNESEPVVRGTFGYADKGLLLECPLNTSISGENSRWKHPPYDGVIEGGKMYGRGTANSKAGIVCIIYAILALKKFIAEEGLRVELIFDGREEGTQSYNTFSKITDLKK